MENKIAKSLLIVSFFIILCCSSIFADSWKRSDQTVTIMPNGDVNISEAVNVIADRGSEWYIELDGVSAFEIENIDVYDVDNQTHLDYKSDWDSNNSSLEAKKGKRGTNITSKGIEICWGKGELNKEKSFIVSYTIPGLVKLTIDNKAIFNHKFIDAKGSNFLYSLKINSDKTRLVDENSNVWLFGSEKVIDYEYGGIAIQSGRISGNESIIVMLEVDDSVVNFNELTKTAKSSEDIKNLAFKGSSYSYNIKNNVLARNIIIAIGVILIIISSFFHRNPLISTFLIIFIAIGGYCIFPNSEPNITVNGVRLYGEEAYKYSRQLGLIFYAVSNLVSGLFGVVGFRQNKIKKLIKNVNYHRDCPKDLVASYETLSKIEPYIKKDNKVNLLGAMILDMTKNGNLEVVKTEDVGAFGKVKTKESFIFKKSPEDLHYLQLYTILQKAAGENGILEEQEITNYAKIYYDEIHGFIQSCKGYNLLNMFSINQVSDFGENAEELIGLRNYFKDFTLLDEREIREVHNWGDMLVYATLLGVADKVMDRLKIVIPDQINSDKTLSNYSSHYGFINSFSNSLTNTYKSSYSQAHRSSGSGGSGSSGGGGGFSGGGGRGGR